MAYVDYRKSSADKIVDSLEVKLSAIRAGNTVEKIGQGREFVLDSSILNLNLSKKALGVYR